MQPSFKDWLNRKPAGRKVRKRIPKVSKRRASRLGEYRKKREAFLSANPYCQIWMRRMGLTEKDAVLWGGQYFHRPTMTIYWAPRSQEIHHVRGRIGAMLLDERYWLAASRSEHDWCHSHPSQARALGLLK